MRVRTLTSSASALLLVAATVANASHSDIHQNLDHLHKRHRAHREHARSAVEDGEFGVELRSISAEDAPSEASIEKRGQCVFPGAAAGLVPVNPSGQNAGWAMSPDQPCLPGNYCPYACPPGQLSMQWDPSATSYTYPQSMNGGLYCDNSGKVNKPFPDKPYCASGTVVVGVQNHAGSVVSFCQTVLPGNEAMLIPTSVTGWQQIAIPDMSYWASTAAHYYINPPGIGPEQACVWGTSANPYGNWAPYVAGGNTDANGNTFLKLGWNPIYLEQATPFRTAMPNWGVSIECEGSGCNGLPCAIDPSQNHVNEMMGSASNGAGGGAFCVVTVPKGVSAQFVVSMSGSGSGSGSGPGPGAGPGAGGPPGQGGQFFQPSSAGAPGWSSSASTAASVTTTPPSTTSASSSTHWTSSTTVATGSSDHNATSSGAAYAPSNAPYYSLFNSSSPSAASAKPVSSETAAASTSAVIAPSIIPSKGAASAIEASFASFLLVVALASIALCV